MSADALPFITAVLAAFGVFIVAVGGVWIWTNLPGRQG